MDFLILIMNFYFYYLNHFYDHLFKFIVNYHFKYDLDVINFLNW